MPTPIRCKKHLALHDLGVGEYLTDKYASWIDFRTTDENTLHVTGRGIGSEGGGIPCKLKRNRNRLDHLILTYT